MDLIFGDGSFTEGEIHCEGRIILEEHKLLLRGAQGDLTQTFIPLEKIERIKKLRGQLEVQFRPTMTMQYKARISGDPRNINELLKELVSRRKFKKKFLRNEWVDPLT